MNAEELPVFIAAVSDAWPADRKPLERHLLRLLSPASTRGTPSRCSWPPCCSSKECYYASAAHKMQHQESQVARANSVNKLPQVIEI
nr:unnamed protein product [Digitaria exilis]